MFSNSFCTFVGGMKNSLYHLCPLWLLACLQGFVISVLLTACSDGTERRLQLEELERQNRADSVMTNDSLARDLADYFDRHGTPNERMRAHYILGRTYADCGEAPQAIEAYNDAAAAADTTATDCDYHTLCRVYSQMAELFYKQNLLNESLRCFDLSIAYAYMDGDTLAALNSYGHKIGPYDQKGLVDSVIYICNKVYQDYCSLGYRQVASQFCGFAMSSYLKKGDTENAKRQMDIYEKQSGYFNGNGDIEAGREVFYNFKGRYFLALCQYDSAEHYFRKELRLGHDFNNQNMGSKGLARLFQATHRSDSATKYALYSYAMNDSVYTHMATVEVVKMEALYDYTCYQKQVQQEKEETRKEKIKSLFTLIIASAIVALAIFLYIYKRHEQPKEYDGIVENLEKANDEILHFRSHESALNHVIEEKSKKLDSQKEELLQLADLKTEKEQLDKKISEHEIEIERLKAELEKYQKRESLTKDSVDKELNQSKVFSRLKITANQGRRITDEEWHEVMQLIIRLMPGFYNLISAKERNLRHLEYQICVFERLGIEPSRIGLMLGVSESYISKLRSNLHLKVFGSEGSRADFNREILLIY